MGNLTLATLTIAIASILANAWLVKANLSLHDQLTETKASVKSAERQRDAAQGTALDCGNAVDELHKLSGQRAEEAATARATAATYAKAAAKRADVILSAPAAVPGNDCQSAKVRIDAWLQGRAAP